MAREARQQLRLSTTELEDAMREEKKKWRIFRLQQVREQARIEAGRVRGAVHRRKVQVVHNLGQEILRKWEDDKENQVQQLQEEYDGCFKNIGKAHGQAKEQPDAVEVLAQNMAINRQKATRRGCEANRTQKEYNMQKEKDENRPTQLRKSAIRKEKLRACRVAQLPTPEACKKKKIIIPKPVPTVQLYEHGTLTTTNYVPKNVVIEKEIKSTKPSAHLLAEAEEKTRVSVEETERSEAEDMERKREERGRAALRKERLHRMYRSMVEQLDQAHHDHQLSAFIRGADLSTYETEESRLNGLAVLQHNMEAAVERVLQDKSVETDEEDLTQVNGVMEEVSDLKEISEDSRLETMTETIATKEKGLHEFQEEIKRRRQHISQAIENLEDSTLEKEPECLEISDVQKPDLNEDSETSTQMDSEANQDQREIEESSEKELGRQVSPQSVRPKDVRVHGQKDDIHFAETVPVHLMPQDRTYREFVAKDPTSCRSSSEKTVQPASSDDIEVRIQFSSDSSATSSRIPAPDRYIRPTIPACTDKKSSKRYHEELVYSAGDSTEYLSLPSSFSPVRENLTYLDNLEKIQEQRRYIQRLLDTRAPTRDQELLSPITYMQEMSSEGSRRKPLSKREKFELKKREILHHYVRKLISLKDDELMQISASTVEGSGITVSSLGALLESLNKDSEDSVFSSSAYLTESSSEPVPSPFYPDIDEIPTKLSSSSSPEVTINPNLPITIPRNYSDYDPKVYIHPDQEAIVSSSSDMDIRTNFVHPNEVESLGSSPEHDIPHVCTSPRLPDFLPNVQATSQYASDGLASVEDSSTMTSYTGDLKGDEANLQREVKILQDLRTLQRLKQELLKEKGNLVKENEVARTSSHHGYKTSAAAAATTSQLDGTEPQKVEHKTKFDDKSNQQTHRRVTDSIETGMRSGEWRTVPLISRQEVLRNMNEESDTDDSEENFVALKPQTSYGSVQHSPESMFLRDGSRKSLDARSFTGIRFKHLFPEATLQSERISSDLQTSSSSLTDVGASSLLPDKVGDSGDSSVIATGHKESGFVHQTGSLEKDEKTDKTKIVPPNPDETLSSMKETNVSSGTNRDVTLTSVREDDVSSEMPKDSSINQSTISNEYDKSGAVVRKRTLVRNIPQKSSSSESVTSIPDMAEILQRFGLDWAKSMIRKMDKTEANSSSGN